MNHKHCPAIIHLTFNNIGHILVQGFITKGGMFWFRIHLRAFKFQNFPRGACPQTPLDWLGFIVYPRHLMSAPHPKTSYATAHGQVISRKAYHFNAFFSTLLWLAALIFHY